MSWLKIETNTPDKPEIWAIADALQIDADAVFGKVFRVWRWFDEHTEDGNARGVTFSMIDRIAGVTGFAQAMADTEWLIKHEGSISLPNFDRHNGQSAKKRANTAVRVANHKAKAKEGNAPVTLDALPREEKRREEVTPTNPNGLVVASTADDLSRQRPKSAKPACPHQEIIALYHELLPASPMIREWTPARAEHLRVRWNEDEKRQNLDWWRRFFGYIGDSAFLTGKACGANRKPFTPGLDWICKAENFAKIREGRFHDVEAA